MHSNLITNERQLIADNDVCFYLNNAFFLWQCFLQINKLYIIGDLLSRLVNWWNNFFLLLQKAWGNFCSGFDFYMYEGNPPEYCIPKGGGSPSCMYMYVCWSWHDCYLQHPISLLDITNWPSIGACVWWSVIWCDVMWCDRKASVYPIYPGFHLTAPIMDSSTNFQAPPHAAYFLWSCDKVYHKQEVCFLLYFLGQIVSWQYNPNLLD